MSSLTKRLKEARRRAGLSQETLGIEAGLDPMSAKVRMSRYEGGQRVPNPELVERIARVLGVPSAYFYATDNDLAALLLAWGRMKRADRARLLAHALEVSP